MREWRTLGQATPFSYEAHHRSQNSTRLCQKVLCGHFAKLSCHIRCHGWDRDEGARQEGSCPEPSSQSSMALTSWSVPHSSILHLNCNSAPAFLPQKCFPQSPSPNHTLVHDSVSRYRRESVPVRVSSWVCVGTRGHQRTVLGVVPQELTVFLRWSLTRT